MVLWKATGAPALPETNAAASAIVSTISPTRRFIEPRLSAAPRRAAPEYDRYFPFRPITIRLDVISKRSATVLACATFALLLAASGLGAAAAPRGAKHPTAAVTRSMLRIVHEQLCFKQNAWLSGRDRHYGLIITQVSCGGTYFDHWWLHRKSLSVNAPWTVLSERRGTIDKRAGCTSVKRIPADIRCK